MRCYARSTLLNASANCRRGRIQTSLFVTLYSRYVLRHVKVPTPTHRTARDYTSCTHRRARPSLADISQTASDEIMKVRHVRSSSTSDVTRRCRRTFHAPQACGGHADRMPRTGVRGRASGMSARALAGQLSARYCAYCIVDQRVPHSKPGRDINESPCPPFPLPLPSTMPLPRPGTHPAATHSPQDNGRAAARGALIARICLSYLVSSPRYLSLDALCHDHGSNPKPTPNAKFVWR